MPGSRPPCRPKSWERCAAPIAAALGRDRDDVAGLDRGEGGAAGAAHGHLRAPSAAACRCVPSAKPICADPPPLVDHDRRAPVLVVEADVGVGECGRASFAGDRHVPQRPGPAAPASKRISPSRSASCAYCCNAGRTRCAPTARPHRRCTGPTRRVLAELVDQLAADFLDEIAADALELGGLARGGDRAGSRPRRRAAPG